MIVRGTHDEQTLRQMEAVAEAAAFTALMADGHMGYVMPIGGVAAYENHVSLNGVGVDIACGNCAIQTDLHIEDIADHLDDYADEIVRSIGFGMGSPTNPTKDDQLRDHELFVSPAWELIPTKVRGNLREQARAQLGTVGGGNHYVDVFADEEGRVWVGVHFGSRGLGFKIAHGMAAVAQGLPWGERANMGQEILLDMGTELGVRYWHLMQLAGDYAYAGRAWAARKVVDILGGIEVDRVHNNHNFAWAENHFGRGYFVVRKGATPAFPGQRGFVGGSMGDISVILRGAYSTGVDHQTFVDQRCNLFSTVHGAGRVMGRMQAKGKWKRGECVREGLITHESWAEALPEGLVLRGGDLDEAPQAYRPLHEVLDAQGETIEIMHTLAPVIVCMAPSRTRGR